MQNRVMKYITNIGQKTGILNIWNYSKLDKSLKQSNELTWKKVVKVAMNVDLETLYQNLNSGNRLIKGRNSSFDLVGNPGPSSDKIQI